ncbi:RdgB/HAM1 family non-canonical purine NTP pyrophosphatase [Tessaracoccus sp. SD287]|uniref:RdgB/HAM1 family non-canonical purine NTP pyrophosphatase n=1 Tax=Tessaracoccus sp. SD287 TaxID=2782008 RepID=UPI001A95DC18|nr:RdgB/HAM1 family non-canonical purine NTP pyrophosphatase [Tessaracoccus sp. SD287]MBO1032113.1 RdgB/HAM1 family non-canonical purine NTP pyrophosphatase [Tessaracoccus sp. SD287]
MPKVVLASHNAAKLAEMRRLFAAAELGMRVVSLDDFPESTPPAETGDTFAENALIKARAAARLTGLPALADDSGIEVDVLNGMPGVRSARWAGPAGDDQANLELLLRQVDDVAAERRQARFVCAMAHVDVDGTELVTTGVWPGSLATEPAGSHGFGYDPIFIPADSPLTSAQLTPEQKDSQSHRARAAAAMIEALRRRATTQGES